MDVDGACRGLRQRPVCREPSRPVRSGEPPLVWAAAVPLVSDTAYPRLEPAPSPAEVVRFTPTLAEIAFVHRRTRQPGPRLALLVLLKTFQRLGYFIPLGQVPTPVVEHVAIHVPGLASPGAALAGYETSTYRSRLTGLVRDFVGVSAFGRTTVPRGPASRRPMPARTSPISSTPRSRSWSASASSCRPSGRW